MLLLGILNSLFPLFKEVLQRMASSHLNSHWDLCRVGILDLRAEQSFTIPRLPNACTHQPIGTPQISKAVGWGLLLVGPELWSIVLCIWRRTRSPPCFRGCMVRCLCSLSRNCISSSCLLSKRPVAQKQDPSSTSCQTDLFSTEYWVIFVPGPILFPVHHPPSNTRPHSTHLHKPGELAS